MKYILFVFSTLIFSLVARAGFRIEGVTGVSYSDLSTSASATTVTKVYGGIAGTCNSTSPSSTCNSCVSTTPGEACNKTSVHPILQIGFRIVVDEVFLQALFIQSAQVQIAQTMHLPEPYLDWLVGLRWIYQHR